MADPIPIDFDAMFREDPDPWRFRSRWYEHRKRALTLACLPASSYRSAFEPGCANGELSASLAGRCERLLVADGSDVALQHARRRLLTHGNVELRRLRVPHQWPEERFDLIVISELAYYLSGEEVDSLATAIERSLQGSATVLACHWRHPITGLLLTGDDVHQRLRRRLALPHQTRVCEADLIIDVWSTDPDSIAQREGLR